MAVLVPIFTVVKGFLMDSKQGSKKAGDIACVMIPDLMTSDTLFIHNMYFFSYSDHARDSLRPKEHLQQLHERSPRSENIWCCTNSNKQVAPPPQKFVQETTGLQSKETTLGVVHPLVQQRNSGRTKTQRQEDSVCSLPE